MAKAETKMPEEFLLKLSRLGDKTDEIIPKVLEAGGEVALAKVKGKTRDETRQAVREAQGQAHTASSSPPTPPVSSPGPVVREVVAALDALKPGEDLVALQVEDLFLIDGIQEILGGITQGL